MFSVYVLFLLSATAANDDCTKFRHLERRSNDDDNETTSNSYSSRLSDIGVVLDTINIDHGYWFADDDTDDAEAESTSQYTTMRRIAAIATTRFMRNDGSNNDNDDAKSNVLQNVRGGIDDGVHHNDGNSMSDAAEWGE